MYLPSLRAKLKLKLATAAAWWQNSFFSPNFTPKQVGYVEEHRNPKMISGKSATWPVCLTREIDWPPAVGES
jgi:hypothetical protein